MISANAAATYTVSIREEPDAGHHSKTNMVPAERCLVDFGQSHASAFIRIRNVSLLQ